MSKVNSVKALSAKRLKHKNGDFPQLKVVATRGPLGIQLQFS